MHKSNNLMGRFVSKYMLRPVARCKAGCSIHDARCMMQDARWGDGGKDA
ncbi:MAG: hypothetical protein WBD99_10820 [Thermodesulfobacteriota bacterium]